MGKSLRLWWENHGNKFLTLCNRIFLRPWENIPLDHGFYKANSLTVIEEMQWQINMLEAMERSNSCRKFVINILYVLCVVISMYIFRLIYLAI